MKQLDINLEVGVKKSTTYNHNNPKFIKPQKQKITTTTTKSTITKKTKIAITKTKIYSSWFPNKMKFYFQIN